MLLTDLSSSTPSNLLLCFWEIFKLPLPMSAAMLFLLICWHSAHKKVFQLNDELQLKMSVHQRTIGTVVDRVPQTTSKAFTCEHHYFQKNCDCSKWQRMRGCGSFLMSFAQTTSFNLFLSSNRFSKHPTCNLKPGWKLTMFTPQYVSLPIPCL